MVKDRRWLRLRFLVLPSRGVSAFGVPLFGGTPYGNCLETNTEAKQGRGVTELCWHLCQELWPSGSAWPAEL